MSEADAFTLVGPGYRTVRPARTRRTLGQRLRGKPIAAVIVFALIAGGCLFAEAIANHDPGRFYLANRNQPPGAEFYFGTDSLGRDIYSNIWYGGRISLFIGLCGMGIIAALGIAYGCLSGMASGPVDRLMMRAVELAQSMPTLLTVLLVVSLLGRHDVFSISVIIGATAWFGLARIVRSEVRQIRNSEYILAARCMGASPLYLMRRHLAPNFISAILFVVISSISACMAMESTLSFLGLGLPLDTPSWGSMLSLADKALLLNTWWVVAIPGAFLVVTLLCVNSIGSHFRRKADKRPSNL